MKDDYIGCLLSALACLMILSICLCTGVIRDGHKIQNCQDVCHPVRGLAIEDQCHCATENGWERRSLPAEEE